MLISIFFQGIVYHHTCIDSLYKWTSDWKSRIEIKNYIVGLLDLWVRHFGLMLSTCEIFFFLIFYFVIFLRREFFDILHGDIDLANWEHFLHSFLIVVYHIKWKNIFRRWWMSEKEINLYFLKALYSYFCNCTRIRPSNDDY